jgi:hypothetical protein
MFTPGSTFTEEYGRYMELFVPFTDKGKVPGVIGEKR